MAFSPPGETREKVFRFVRQRLAAGAPPTVREVQQALGFQAVETARAHLEALVAEGRLRKEQGQARGYRLVSSERREARGEIVGAPLAAPNFLFIPLLGQVQAGALTTAIENPEGYLALPSSDFSSHLKPEAWGPKSQASPLFFALRVEGESMIGAGILPGDIAIVRRQQTAQDGEIVVALVEDEATVKRLRRRAGRVELQPENPAFPVIAPDPEALTILGKVIEVRRYFEELPLLEGPWEQ
jgi:repressor LexA